MQWFKHILKFIYFLAKGIQPFLSYPESTRVTPLLDQQNKNIHQQYEKEKSFMFTEFNTLNRESFMLILANIWGTRTSMERIVNAIRTVGVTKPGSSADLMPFG